MPIVWCQQFLESEAGWGTRPDGYLLAETEEKVRAATKECMERQEEYFKSKGVKGTPAEYSRPCGEPYRCEVDDDVKMGRSFDRGFPKPIDADAKPGWISG